MTELRHLADVEQVPAPRVQSRQLTVAERVQAWMLRHGWDQVSEGRAGSMWMNPQFGEEHRIGVLRAIAFDSHEYDDLIARLASTHSVVETQLSQAIINWANDITYLRAANDYVIHDTIPLNAGAVMLESARMMFRAAATAAVRVRPAINGSFSKFGDEVADRVRMGHTIRGSYVVPILVDVGQERQETRPDEGVEGSLFDVADARETVESLERRATRTFAQAFAAVHDRIVEPERLPSEGELMELIARGVTREFVTAVTRVLQQDAVATLDASFEWAPAQGGPAGTPARVEIPATAASKIEETGRKLRAAKRPQHEIFTGPVVVVEHEPDETVTRFAIRTMRGGKSCRIETTTRAPVDEVLEWMRRQVIVQVRGRVSRSGGSLAIAKPFDVAAFNPMTADE